jgi:hypothetical protein
MDDPIDVLPTTEKSFADPIAVIPVIEILEPARTNCRTENALPKEA